MSQDNEIESQSDIVGDKREREREDGEPVNWSDFEYIKSNIKKILTSVFDVQVTSLKLDYVIQDLRERLDKRASEFVIPSHYSEKQREKIRRDFENDKETQVISRSETVFDDERLDKITNLYISIAIEENIGIENSEFLLAFLIHHYALSSIMYAGNVPTGVIVRKYLTKILKFSRFYITKKKLSKDFFSETIQDGLQRGFNNNEEDKYYRDFLKKVDNYLLNVFTHIDQTVFASAWGLKSKKSKKTSKRSKKSKKTKRTKKKTKKKTKKTKN
jgi:hypothetical protein